MLGRVETSHIFLTEIHVRWALNRDCASVLALRTDENLCLHNMENGGRHVRPRSASLPFFCPSYKNWSALGGLFFFTNGNKMKREKLLSQQPTVNFLMFTYHPSLFIYPDGAEGFHLVFLRLENSGSTN